jgi:hypothetical protein
MEGWQQDFIKGLETVTQGIDQFFQEVGKEMSEAADAWLEFTEEIAEEIVEEIERTFEPLEAVISPTLERLDEQLVDWVEPIILAIVGFEETLDRAAEPITHTVEPLVNQHPICIGCRHYHGQVYNGTMFVCAMHPYGIVDGSDQCPDKERIAWSLPAMRSSETPEDEDF